MPKSVDIYAETKKGVIKIDAKAGRTKGNWPIIKDSVQNDVFYIFVHLGTDTQIKNNVPPEYFIVTGRKIRQKGLVEIWKTWQGIRYTTLNDKKYKESWGKLPTPK